MVNSSHILSDIGVWTLFASPFVFLCCFFSDSLNFHKRFLVLLADSWQWEVCVMHTLPFNSNSKFTKNHHWHVGECLLDLCIRSPPPQKTPKNQTFPTFWHFMSLFWHYKFYSWSVLWSDAMCWHTVAYLVMLLSVQLRLFHVKCTDDSWVIREGKHWVDTGNDTNHNILQVIHLHIAKRKIKLKKKFIYQVVIKSLPVLSRG